MSDDTDISVELQTKATDPDFRMLLEVVRFYADPDTYFATFIVGDPPCGAINDDWSTHDHPDYDDGDERPGHVARTALKRVGFGLVDPCPDFDYLEAQGLLVADVDEATA